MEDKEFITETLNRLIPESKWHGDSQKDSASLDNIEVQEQALKTIWQKLFRDIKVYGQAGNASAEDIMEKKKNVLMDFIGNELQNTLCEINMFVEIYHEEEGNTDDTSTIN
jgi:hypothetical protein